MREWICDIEANRLIDPDKIWCVCFINTVTEEEVGFKLDEVHTKMPQFIRDNVDSFIGHNFIGYDLGVLNELVEDVNIKWTQVQDTLILSHMFNPIVKKKDPKTGKIFKGRKRVAHSLDDWGKTLGTYKGSFNEFDRYSEEMYEYCMQDCRVNLGVYRELMEEKQGYSDDAIRTEHASQYILSKQQKHGFLLDMGKVLELEKEISREEERLRKHMEENVCTIYYADRS